MLHKWKINVPLRTGKEERTAYVYVPDGDIDDRYPVLYMFDGHNLFYDDEATYGKSWGLLEYLEETNTPVIIAAVECNHHDEAEKCGGRLAEYSPFSFTDFYWGSIRGFGDKTMDWFIRVFKPYVDEHYPTLSDRRHTFIAGSSMGGLMTLYAVLCHNDVFSRGAALSPAIGFSKSEVMKMIENCQIDKDTVLYMDSGDQEFRRKTDRKNFGNACRKLIEKGVLLEARIVPDGIHSESSWEKQIPFFMNTLLYEL